MKKVFVSVMVAAISFVFFTGCEKKTETFETAALQEYYPLSVGKVFIYRLDSTITASFGVSLLTKSYQAMDTIESTFTDNKGRLSYRIFRFTRDTLGLQPWKFAATYYATPTATTVEYVDNNNRFIKLHLPFTEGYTWPGNSFLNSYSYLENWKYENQNVGMPMTINNKKYDNTVTVFQIDETSPPGPFNPSLSFQEKIFSKEVYAKNVGMIYKEFLYWQWQKPSSAPGAFQDNSYGVKMQLISYK
jgi:hypothetical protein